LAWAQIAKNKKKVHRALHLLHPHSASTALEQNGLLHFR
jgi:hypothetical protein